MEPQKHLCSLHRELFLPQGMEPLESKTVRDSKNRDGYSTVSHRDWKGVQSARQLSPGGSWSFQLRGTIQKVTLPQYCGALTMHKFSPPLMSAFSQLLLTQGPPPSHGPFSVTAAQHQIPSCFPGQRKSKTPASVLDPD